MECPKKKPPKEGCLMCKWYDYYSDECKYIPKPIFITTHKKRLKPLTKLLKDKDA